MCPSFFTVKKYLSCLHDRLKLFIEQFPLSHYAYLVPIPAATGFECSPSLSLYPYTIPPPTFVISSILSFLNFFFLSGSLTSIIPSSILVGKLSFSILFTCLYHLILVFSILALIHFPFRTALKSIFLTLSLVVRLCELFEFCKIVTKLLQK